MQPKSLVGAKCWPSFMSSEFGNLFCVRTRKSRIYGPRAARKAVSALAKDPLIDEIDVFQMIAKIEEFLELGIAQHFTHIRVLFQ